MIGPVYLFRAGCFALSGLGCGLAASLLKGRTIANWTWMASTMTFQQGAMIGSGLAVANLCLDLFFKQIDKISWIEQPLKLLAKVCITSLLFSPVIHMSWQGPILSRLTFVAISILSVQTISTLYARACQPKPPFYYPPGWNWVDISQQVDLVNEICGFLHNLLQTHKLAASDMSFHPHPLFCDLHQGPLAEYA